MRTAVFASGGGTNLQALIDAVADDGTVSVVLVLSDRPGIGALQRAERAGIATHVLSDHRDGAEILSVLETAGVDFIVLAGYLRLIPREVVHAFSGRMINIHPALLPSFGGPGMYGRRVHEAVLQSGARITGPTIHLVTAEYDKGQILAQWPVPVLADDTPDSLAARVLDVEHRLLPEVVKSIAANGVGTYGLRFTNFIAASPDSSDAK